MSLSPENSNLPPNEKITAPITSIKKGILYPVKRLFIYPPYLI
jgi:hypothetical protein